MIQNIKNPSLIPDWFIKNDSGKVIGVRDANGSIYQFVGSSEKGEDGKTPLLAISAEDGYKWYVSYDGTIWNEVQGSPAASGLVGPEGPQGISGDSVKVDSIVNETGGTTVTLAWGENFTKTSSFFVPSGLSGANGKDGTDGKDGQNGISPTVTTTTIQPDTTHTNGGIEVTISGADGEHKYSAWNGNNGETSHILDAGSGISIQDDKINAKIGTDLTFDDVTSAIKIDTNGNPNNTASNNRNFVEGSWTVANGYNCHAEGAGTSALGYGVHAQGMWTCFSSSKWGDNKHIDTDIYWAIGAGAAVEGYCNATTSCPMSGTEGNNYGAVHGGILKVIGNGYIEHDQYPDPDAHSHTHHPSDALILYRDGSLSAAGKISAAGIELGAGGGTSYQGRSGINVADNYIELTQTAYNALTSVSNKVDKPTSLVNKYLVLRTDNSGDVSGWYDFTDQCYNKDQANSRFVATAFIDTTTLSGYGNASNRKLGVNTNVIQTKLTEEQLSAISDVSSKLDRDDLDDYIPYSAISLPIGTNNTVTDYSMGIGYSNIANYGDVQVSQQVQYGSLAFGYQNSASKMSFAAGNGNKALHVGFAVGYHCSATEHAVAMNNNCGANDYSFAEGNNNKANKYSFAGGLNCIADDYSFAYGEATSAIGKSFAYGPANTAYNYSHLIGRGLEYSGASTADYNIGAFVIGGWNATTSWETYATSPLFIIGNGGSTRSDAFVVYRNGALKAGNDTTAKESNSVAFGTLSQASGNCAFVAGAWCNAIGQGAHAEGNSCGTTGYGNHIQGSFNLFESNGTAYNGPANTPVFVGGTLNATTAQNYNDHGGYLQIMGNGTYQSQGTGTRSDAYILYRDGTVSAKQFQNADGTDTINGTTYSFTGVDNIEILPLAATANTANFPNDNVLRFILES